MSKKYEQRIGTGTAALMVGFALFFDVIEMILVALGVGLVSTMITTPLCYGVLWGWFLMKGVSFIKSKRMGKATLFGIVLNFVPLMPAITGTVIMNVWLSREEDKEKWEEEQKKKKVKRSLILGGPERRRAYLRSNNPSRFSEARLESRAQSRAPKTAQPQTLRTNTPALKNAPDRGASRRASNRIVKPKLKTLS